jgi:hypothetical protein
MRQWKMKMLIVSAGLLPIAMLMTTPSQAMAQDDQLPIVAPQLPQFHLRDHKCGSLPPGSPYTARLCVNLGSCSGTCVIGETIQPVKVCVPNQGTQCTASPGLVKIRVKKQASCTTSSDRCDCGAFTPVNPPVVQTLPANLC